MSAGAQEAEEAEEGQDRLTERPRTTLELSDQELDTLHETIAARRATLEVWIGRNPGRVPPELVECESGRLKALEVRLREALDALWRSHCSACCTPHESDGFCHVKGCSKQGLP